MDTGVFDRGPYWSVDVAYAKASPTEVLCQDHDQEPCVRRGDSLGAAHPVVPQHVAWFPADERRGSLGRYVARRGRSPRLSGYRLDAAPGRTARRPRPCSATTRPTRRDCSARATTPYPKDGINDHVVSGANTVNPDGFGTKAALCVTRHRGGRWEGRAAAAAAPAEAQGRREGDLGACGVRQGPGRTRGRSRRVLRGARAG